MPDNNVTAAWKDTDMGPHLLHDMVAHNTGQSMSDLVYAERISSATPKVRRRMPKWLRLGGWSDAVAGIAALVPARRRLASDA